MPRHLLCPISSVHSVNEFDKLELFSYTSTVLLKRMLKAKYAKNGAGGAVRFRSHKSRVRGHHKRFGELALGSFQRRRESSIYAELV